MPDKILIIENDEPLRGLLSQVLTKEGFIVQARGDKETGLKAFVEFQPDLVITNSRLPDTDDALCLIRDIRQQNKVPMLLHTGADVKNTVLMKSFLEAGINQLLNKPVDLRLLLVTVKNLIKKNR